MTKRPLYAAAQAAASLAALLTVLPASAQTQAPPPSGICAQCLSIAVDQSASGSLPDALDGMEVFIRVTASNEQGALPALLDVEQRGGRPAPLVTGITPSISSEVAGHVRRIVVTEPPRAPGQTDEVFAFSVKTSLTALRAAVSPAAGIGVAADAG